MKGERNAKEKRSNGIDLCTAGFVECWICCVCGIFGKSGQGGHFVRRCRSFGFSAADFSAAARFFCFFTENEGKSPCADLGARSRRRLHPWLQIVLSAFIIQFITIAAIYAADMNLNGYSGTVIQTYARLFITGKGSPVCAPDALSGLGLLSALGEYVFPRAIAAGIGVYRDAALLGIPTAGLVFALNTISVCAAAVMLYELMLLDFEKRTAVFSVRVLLFSPMFVLLLQPTSGLSVFLLFSLAAAYCARRGYYVRSGLFAAAASAFNVFGLLACAAADNGGNTCLPFKKTERRKVCGQLRSLCGGSIASGCGFSRNDRRLAILRYAQ